MLWLMATITVVVLLFGYHTSREGATTTASPPAVVSGQSSGSGQSSQSGTSGSTSAGDTTTFTGDTAQTQWGPVQVEITVAGGKVTGVQVPIYPSGNHRDQEINDYALPVLVDETLSAQGADIDMVSGATVTSQGYLTSLQSALDQAGL